MASFSVSFFDAGGGLLNSFTGSAANVGNNWQDYTFPEIQGVSTAQYTILSGLAGSLGVETSEIRFSGTTVPEPTSALLAGWAAMMFGVRRCRRSLL